MNFQPTVGIHKASSTDADIALQREREGRCGTCGTHTHQVNRKLLQFRAKKIPLTVAGQVQNGRCLACHPLHPTKKSLYTWSKYESSSGGSKNQKLGNSTISDSAAAVLKVKNSINETLHELGGPYASYSCQFVSWDDVSRDHHPGHQKLSAMGQNITDTYLTARDGTQLFTVRPDNWDERLGVIKADELAVVVGEADNSLQPVTLTTVLRKIGQYGKLAKLDPSTRLYHRELDKEVSIRFQTTFIPLEHAADSGSNRERRESVEFAVESRSYNTKSNTEPANIILLCTTQGMAVQANEVGRHRLFHHYVPPHGNFIEQYWLEAERSRHGVGGPQAETAHERSDALQRGKATASVIGTQAMGTRFNALMTVQVPVALAPPSRPQPPSPTRANRMPSLFQSSAASTAPASVAMCALPHEEAGQRCGSWPNTKPSSSSSSGAPPPASNAARVSLGSKYGDWYGISPEPQKYLRHPSQRLTVTVVLYNVVVGGAPTREDVQAAIDDMEQLYSSCSGGQGRLSNDRMFSNFKNGGKLPEVKNYEVFPTTS